MRLRSSGVGPIAIALFVSVVAFSQQAKAPRHSWEILMNDPEAKAAAKKLLGHCGDAGTQDVMNACFALEYQNADAEMNKMYRKMLNKLDKDIQIKVRAAQRAWLRYRDLHCDAVGSLYEGGSVQPTEVFSCRTGVTSARTREIKEQYSTP